MRAEVAAILLVLPWISVRPALSHEPTPSRYNYWKHVRPLFVEHCGGCHRSGGVAPMSLLEYQEAVPWANAIKLQLLEERMPPFLPAEESPPLRHARGLTAEELDVLVDWAVGATPQGEPPALEEADSAPAPSEDAADLVLQPSADVVLEEDEYEETACVVLETGLDRARVASALELVPGEPRVLRRGTVYLGGSCSNAEPLVSWLPDQTKLAFPEGTGRRVPAGSSLALELRYQKGWEDEGKRIVDRSALRVWFSDSAAPLRTVRVESTRRLESEATIVALYPDPPADIPTDEPLRVEAVSPDGRVLLLLAIDHFDRAWQERYVLVDPLSVPSGTEIRSSQPVVWVDVLGDTRASAQ